MAFGAFVILGYERARIAEDDAERDAWMTLCARFEALVVAEMPDARLRPVAPATDASMRAPGIPGG